jgi:hypothetical protein
MKIRNEKYIKFTSLCIIAITALCSPWAIAADTVLSDPDHISTGFEYRGVSDVRLGDTFGTGRFSIGGMADIRNESRFNQEALPNHNWRGFGYIYADQALAENEELLKLTYGFEHESAHPTMGFNEGNDKAYDKIYDSTYRNTNLNSAMLRLSSTSGSGYSLTLTGDMQFYFNSRNTPELPVNELTWSGGISGGIEFKYPVAGDVSFFISVFDRYIFQSRKTIKANIYHDSDSGVVTRYEEYPVINNVNTFSAKAGLILNTIIPERKISLYCGFLYGNIYGFVDSREKRTVYSLGIEIFH